MSEIAPSLNAEESVGHCKLYIVPCSSCLMLNNRDLENVNEGHSDWYHSKAWVRFPIRLLEERKGKGAYSS